MMIWAPVVAPAMAEDMLYFTYGFEEGNSLIGQHYGQQEYRHILKSALDKKMDNFKLVSEYSMFYSSLDRFHFQTVRLGLNQIAFGRSLLSINLGDNTANLPYNVGAQYNRNRGAMVEYRYRGVSAGIFGGTPSDLYRATTSLKGRNIMGSFLGIRPVSWLSEKIFAYQENSILSSDTLNRKATGVGQQMDIMLPQGLEMMLAAGWKERQEEKSGSVIKFSAPSVSTSMAWATGKSRISGALDFFGANFRPLQAKSFYGPRLYASWRPTEIFGLNARFTNNNAYGDSLYPDYINTWGAGSSVKYPHLPSLSVNYSNTDNKVEWGGPNTRWYVSDVKSMDLSQTMNRFEMSVRFQADARTERNAQLMDARRQSWRIKPTYKASWATFWISSEFDRWNDSRQKNSGHFNRYRAGTNAALWNGSRAIAEFGFNDQGTARYGRNGSLIANLQMKFNLSQKYLLDLSWRSENSVDQDTGFFYIRDRSSLGIFITRRMDIAGNSVDGMVFLDANKNGRQDAGEHGLPGVMMNLSDGRRAITDAKGRYRFTKINANSPTVKLDLSTLSAEYNIIGSNERQASLGGWRSTLVNFAVSALGGIKGRVFADNNNNGKFDGDDYGISGVTIVMQPSNIAAVSNGGGMFRITNAPTGQQTLNIDPNSIPPDYEIKGDLSKAVNIKQGEISNHLEFILAKKVRPVKKVVFGGVSTVKISPITPPAVKPKESGNERPSSKTSPQQSRATVKPKESSAPKLSTAEIDALYKEGTRLYSTGDYQGALKIWQKILRSDPGHSNARRNLEKTQQKLDALKKAKG
jgi:hypothetical protein